ncbi:MULTISPECIES: Rha family transcriptional regulator [unclassified Methylobacterium]|uniref:Rha family transcriptional regulator n=1 Tax=unclassified Methylobacterium TaxID=2615210 RepID=UPI003702CE44
MLDGGIPRVSSRDLAVHFGKRHADVLRDIDHLLSHDADLRRVEFQEVSEKHPTVTGRDVRLFNMNRDGFALLVMGWSGPTAFTFKLAYLRVRTAKLIDVARPQCSASTTGRGRMAFRVLALVVGVSVSLYRYFKHRDEWGACAFYGFVAMSAVHAVAGLGQDGGEPDYSLYRPGR